jgi:hypothetical protein
LGYQGNLKDLWNKLVVEREGSTQSHDKRKKEVGNITLRNLDPEADTVVGAFLALLQEKFGSIVNGWRQGFKKDMHAHVNGNELSEVCQTMGYEHDAKKLFACLSPVPNCKALCVWDLDPTLARKRFQGRLDEVVAKGNKSLGSTMATQQGDAAISPHGNATMSPMSANRKVTRSLEMRSVTDSIPVTEMLNNHLKRKYGSTLAAWRQVMDPHWNGRLSFGKFNVLMNDTINFSCNLKVLWQELTGYGERSYVTYRDLDPATQARIDSSREALVKLRGSILHAWHFGISPEGRDRVDEGAFVANCDKMGVVIQHPSDPLALLHLGKPFKRASRIFRMLMTKSGQRSITTQDMEIFLMGVPDESRAMVWCGVSQSELDTILAFTETDSGATPSVMDDIRMIARKWCNQDRMIRVLADFRRYLTLVYGSLWSAWNTVLDPDQSGELYREDMDSVCSTLGIDKSGSERLLDMMDRTDDEIPIVTLREMCRETAISLENFRSQCKKRKGSTREAWTEATTQLFGGNEFCDKDQFVALCKEVGYPFGFALGKGPGFAPPARFFDIILPAVGAVVLSYEDLCPPAPPEPPAPVAVEESEPPPQEDEPPACDGGATATAPEQQTEEHQAEQQLEKEAASEPVAVPEPEMPPSLDVAE